MTIINGIYAAGTQATKRKNYAYTVCTKLRSFPTLEPLSPDRGQISACCHHLPIGEVYAKNSVICNFSYSHSKWVSSSVKKSCRFFAKMALMFWGWRSAPSAQSVPVTYPLDIEDIFVYIAACEPSLAGLRFFRENVSNI